MSIVTFYCGDPKNAPKTTQGAHLGGNAILLWQGKLLLERRVDADVWGLPGGGAKKQETARQAVSREIYEELGLRIPDDLSIIGFDDLEISRYMTPGLTTIKQQISLKGQRAVELLLKNIAQPGLTKQEEILTLELVERESVRKIKGKEG